MKAKKFAVLLGAGAILAGGDFGFSKPAAAAPAKAGVVTERGSRPGNCAFGAGFVCGHDRQ